jgi:LysM repeat protein
MNTPSPLIPQGVTPAKGKSSFFFKVLMILTVHVVVIGGMLLQGCKDTKDNAANGSSQDTASSPDTMPPATSQAGISNAQTSPVTATSQPPAMNPIPAPGQAPGAVAQQPPGAPGAPGAPMAAPPIQPTPIPATPPPAPETGTREYAIASGDTLGAIARKNGVSLKALMDANAGVNPRKLHVGQKIQIPGGTGAGAAATSPEVASGDEAVYTVKAGDTLAKIAKLNHTSYKKIMALNDLKTTSIKPGQKLKIPAPKVAATETPAPTPAPVVPLQPVPATTTTAAGAPITSNQ